MNQEKLDGVQCMNDEDNESIQHEDYVEERTPLRQFLDALRGIPCDDFEIETEDYYSVKFQKRIKKKASVPYRSREVMKFEMTNKNEDFKTPELILEYHKNIIKEVERKNAEFEDLHKNPVHDGIVCDGCRADPIVGTRFTCSICLNFDYCEQCEATRQHPHPFLKTEDPRYPHSIVAFRNWICERTPGDIQRMDIKTIPEKCHFAVVTNKFLFFYGVQVWFDDFTDRSNLTKSTCVSGKEASEKHNKYWKLCSAQTQVEITNNLITEFIYQKEGKCYRIEVIEVEGHSYALVLIKCSQKKYKLKLYGFSLFQSDLKELPNMRVMLKSGLVLIEESYSFDADKDFENKKRQLEMPCKNPTIEIPNKHIKFEQKIRPDSKDNIQSLSGLINIIKHYKKWKKVYISSTFTNRSMSHLPLLIFLRGDDQTCLCLTVHYGTYEKKMGTNNSLKEWAEIFVSEECRSYSKVKTFQYYIEDDIPWIHIKNGTLSNMNLEFTPRLCSDMEYMIKSLLHHNTYKMLLFDCQSFANSIQMLLRLWKIDSTRRVIVNRIYGLDKWICDHMAHRGR